MRARTVVVALALVAMTACGDDGSMSSISTPASSTAGTTTTTIVPDTSTFPPTGGLPTVLALQSGRGDDGSFEVEVWFAAPPDASGTVIVVGIDSDESYRPGSDVVANLEGSLTIAYGSAGPEQTVTVGGEVVAGAVGGVVGSWGLDGSLLRVFFVQDVAPITGEVWAASSRYGVAGPGGAASVPVGYACSYRGSTVAVDNPPADVPDPGTTCVYSD
jgi:hypothetical protein